MFCSDAQVGRTRVSKVREGLKTKKTHVQHKKDNRTGLDKVFLLQNELFKEGLDLDEYVDYITDKIENKKYFYNGLNSDNIEALKKRYSKLIIEKENTRYNQIGDEKRLNRKRRKQFREKKRNIIREKERITY